MTALAVVHSSTHSPREVMRQLGDIASVSRQILYNADFPDLKKVAQKHSKSLSYGQDKSADYRVDSTETDGAQRTHFVIGVAHNDQAWKIPSYQIGNHSGVAYAAALAAVDILGGSTSRAVEALSTLRPVRGRLNPLRGIRQSLIIDDCYNANMVSMTAGLDTLARFAPPRVAVLGSINELGHQRVTQHRQVGLRVADSADVLVTVGADASQYLASAAHEAGLSKKHIHQFASSREAGLWLKQHLPARATVLGKGSQDGVYVEEALVPIVHPSDRSQLVRQSAFWATKKRRFFEKDTPA